MLISLEQVIHAKWSFHGESGISKYDITIEIDGPERVFMTDVTPIYEEIEKLNHTDLRQSIGHASVEAIAMHVRDLAKRFLDKRDKLKRVKVTEVGEADWFTAELTEA